MQLRQLVKLDNHKIYDRLEPKLRPNVIDTVRTRESGELIGRVKIPYLTFTPYEEYSFLGHGFSTRLGGVSEGIYASMNLTFHLEDDPDNVSENFRRMGKAIGIAPEHMVYTKQTHTTNVMCVDQSHWGMGVTKDRTYDNIDGLITNKPDVCLVTSYADCVPLFFVDPVRRCIAASHSGWRGTVGNIAANTIQKMQKEYGCQPSDIVTMIGPSICVNCYEVSEDVAEQFRQRYKKDEIANIILPGKQPDKYQLNLQMANYYNMIESGISPQNINISDICTCCNSDLLFSHRASHGKRGILCGFIYLRS